MQFRGDPIVPGRGGGTVVATDVPLSLWGGLDPDTGTVIDRHHPLRGACVAGRVLSMPAGRGSCTASGVLLEAIRNGVAPAAILLSRSDPIVGLGAILGEELYGRTVPVVVLPEAARASIASGAEVSVAVSGEVTVTERIAAKG